MAGALAAIDFLAEKHDAPPGVCALFGDEPLLKRLVRRVLRATALAGEDAEFSEFSFTGDQVVWRDVSDALATRSLFGGGRRLVIVDGADDFVSAHRAALEDYVARPATDAVLVLDVGSWPSNTRLYKAVTANGWNIDCSSPAPAKLSKWLVARALAEHRVKLDAAAVEALLEIVGPQLGLLDQELAKLAAFVGDQKHVTADVVNDLVGGWRAKTTWDMLDAALAGDASAALVQLDRLLLSGENPVGLLAQMAASLRRMATAARLIEQDIAEGRRPQLRPALEQAGIKSFVLGKTEGQMRQLGRGRASKLGDWLLESDLALKGGSGLEPRHVLETLIARMSKTAAAATSP